MIVCAAALLFAVDYNRIVFGVLEMGTGVIDGDKFVVE
jgi:hypothetical protein